MIKNRTAQLIYPYFFVNIESQGIFGVFMWIGILLVSFMTVGFAFFGLDRLGKKKV